ncbi:MAG: DUF5058 family protein [Vibrio sp.]
MEEVLKLANSPLMWAFAIVTVSIVVVQSYLFMKLALRFSDKYQVLTATEKKTVFKTATINSIGPSVAIFFLAIGLIAAVGSPMTLMRIGVIGSAYFENYAAIQGNSIVAAANHASGQMNPDVLFEGYTAAVWAMTMGGLGWLISALIFTKRLDKAKHSLAKKNPRALLVVGAITPSTIFAVLVINSFFKKPPQFEAVIAQPHFVAALCSGLSMVLLLWISKRYPWIKEWALGLSFVLGIVGGYLAS